MKWKGFTDVRATIEIDLTKDLDTLWNSVDKDGRYGVRRAERDGLEVGVTTKKADKKEFYKIYKRMCKRKTVTQRTMKSIEADGSYFFVCKKNHVVIAGLVLRDQSGTLDTIELSLNSSTPKFQRHQPNNLLYWAAIVWSKEQGYKIFDLRGWQINAFDDLKGVNKFKERWGGEKKIYKVYSFNPFYIIARKLIRNFKILKLISRKVKTWKSRKK